MHNWIYKTSKQPSFFLSLLHLHPAVSPHTHTHTHTHRAAVALNGREDLTQAERPHVFICVITAVSSSLCPSLRLYSSPSLSPSSLSSLPLSTVWTRLFFFFRPFHPHHHTLTFLSTLHSFILSRCYQWPVASSNQTAASAPRGSVCLAGKLSVCVFLKKPIIHSSKTLCLRLPFFPFVISHSFCQLAVCTMR